MKKNFLLLMNLLVMMTISNVFIACGDDDDNVNKEAPTLSDNGDDEGEKSDSVTVYKSCPDDKHPHMIDLGLPSNTKWACCNVGAQKPEGYGEYYAWGETTTKTVFYWENYLYGSSKEDVMDIGTDISGTQYDAATAKWGEPWQMPTLEQFEELVNHTTSVWTTENEVRGKEFIGSNGNCIFLPAAGYCWDVRLGDGQAGYYWSSTLYEHDSSGADFLYFNENNAYWSLLYRYFGRTIRPVHRNR